MAKITFENGVTVNFDGNPTQQDIEEVAKSLGVQKTAEKSTEPYIPELPETGVLEPTPLGQPSKTVPELMSDAVNPGAFSKIKATAGLASNLFTKATGVRPTDVGREMANILGQGEIMLGTALGGSVVPYTQDWEDLQKSREANLEMEKKVGETIRKLEEAGQNTTRLRKVLINSMSDRGVPDEEINQALKLTTKQVVGAGIQTALDAATAGTYKPAGAVTGQLLKSTKLGQEALVTRKTAPTLLGQFKSGLSQAGVGASIGYGFDVSNRLLEDKFDMKPGLMTALGAIIPMAAKGGEIYGAKRAVKAETKLNEIIEDYRNVVNPLKSDIKRIEVKGGRDLDDALKFMAEEEVVPKKDLSGRMDTLQEADRLQEKKGQIDKLLAESLDDTQQINDLNEVRTRAKAELDKYEKNAEILTKKQEDVDGLIDAEIERIGRTNVTDKELHDIKNGMWTVGYDMNRATKSASAKKAGNIMKQIIEENNIDNLNIQGMNKLSSEYRQAIDLLTNIHGNTVKGGKLGSWFYRMMVGYGLEKVLGKIPGMKGIAFFIGQYIGKHYNEFINDPERIINTALKEAKKIKLDKRSEKILNIFEDGLKKQSIDEWNSKFGIKLLPEAKKGTSGGTMELGTMSETGRQAKVNESGAIKGKASISSVVSGAAAGAVAVSAPVLAKKSQDDGALEQKPKEKRTLEPKSAERTLEAKPVVRTGIRKQIADVESSGGTDTTNKTLDQGKYGWIVGFTKGTYKDIEKKANEGDKRYIDLLAKIDLDTSEESAIDSAIAYIEFRNNIFDKNGKVVGQKYDNWEDKYINLYNANPNPGKRKQALDNWRKKAKENKVK